MENKSKATKMEKIEMSDSMLVIVTHIFTERLAQMDKWGKQRHELGTWLMVLSEEVGEVAEAMQQGMDSEKESDADDLYKELIQVAAVACAIAEQVKEGRHANNP